MFGLILRIVVFDSLIQ